MTTLIKSNHTGFLITRAYARHDIILCMSASSSGEADDDDDDGDDQTGGKRKCASRGHMQHVIFAPKVASVR